ncbi:hypothetical protein, partial [Tenacibaculum finnmarkense]|uniref:hypothetical protein n=1 Tax=Tenacibaculum finnmarkense TaxID=2781243 RepID=UPI001EFB31F9
MATAISTVTSLDYFGMFFLMPTFKIAEFIFVKVLHSFSVEFIIIPEFTSAYGVCIKRYLLKNRQTRWLFECLLRLNS